MNEKTMTAGAPQPTATQPAATPSRSPQKQPEATVQRPSRLAQSRMAPVLRFSPAAWAKLLYFRDREETEVGGFAITSPRDLLKVEDFITVKQKVTVATVSFDDLAVADFFEAQVDAGRKPEQFARHWLHTHPGDSPQPSCTDEETFARVFGACQWAVLFVLARGGKSYARLRFNVGPGGSVIIPVEVDYRPPFGASDADAWEAEYKANILPAPLWGARGAGKGLGDPDDLTRCSVPDNWLEELEAMEPAERQLVMDELAARPDLWGEEGEALL